jgi:hypothetical protein
MVLVINQALHIRDNYEDVEAEAEAEADAEACVVIVSVISLVVRKVD